jgi:hypothetical protein
MSISSHTILLAAWCSIHYEPLNLVNISSYKETLEIQMVPGSRWLHLWFFISQWCEGPVRS